MQLFSKVSHVCLNKYLFSYSEVVKTVQSKWQLKWFDNFS